MNRLTICTLLLIVGLTSCATPIEHSEARPPASQVPDCSFSPVIPYKQYAQTL